METLFGHLALRFQSHPENIATEALCFVLSHSSAARKALISLVANTGSDIAGDLVFRTQESADDLSRPDVVGVDEHGQKLLLIEAKFWAGLTDNQPGSYLEQLPQNNKGLLLFIAPAKRFHTLWPELMERAGGRYQIANTNRPLNEFWYAASPEVPLLGLTSWRCVLQYLCSVLEQDGEYERAADLKQLMGLAERMDDLAFLPIRNEELSPERARRYYDFASLVDEIAAKAEAEGYCSLKGLRPIGGTGFYGRYVSIGNTGAFLSFDAKKWSQLHYSPLWLLIRGVKWKDLNQPRRALSHFLVGEPPRAIIHEDEFLVPIHVLAGEEKEVVVESGVKQLAAVHDCIKDLTIAEAEVS